MAVKVPDEMVYYIERDAQAERLLCWIPPEQYPDVAVDEQALERLRKNYPRGVEVRVHPQELKAEGITLSVEPEALTGTYRALAEKGVLHDSGMIIAPTLERNAKAMEDGESIDALINADRAGPTILSARAPHDEPGPIRRIPDQPLAKGDEEPLDMFRRLSVRQRSPIR